MGCKKDLPAKPRNIGDTYEGGIIFYLDSIGEHGKVCSLIDLGEFEWNGANSQCATFIDGGYSDWYLPSKDELNQIYINLHKEGLGNFDDAFHWSSTENSTNHAWGRDFDTGNPVIANKSVNQHVRAIRVF